MTIDPEFNELLGQTVTLYRLASEDDFGNNTYDAGTAYAARVDTLRKNRGGSIDGDRFVFITQTVTSVIIDYVTPVPTVQDRITLPDGTQPRILSVDVAYDENGPHHITIECQTGGDL